MAFGAQVVEKEPVKEAKNAVKPAYSTRGDCHFGAMFTTLANRGCYKSTMCKIIFISEMPGSSECNGHAKGDHIVTFVKDLHFDRGRINSIMGQY